MDNGIFALYVAVACVHWVLALVMLHEEGIKNCLIVVVIGLLWPLFYAIGFLLMAFFD